jgi:hypothetical protein
MRRGENYVKVARNEAENHEGKGREAKCISL